MPCNKLDYSRSVAIKSIGSFSGEFCETLLWRAGLLERRGEIRLICKHHELVYGDALLRNQRKCCDTWGKHKQKVPGDRIISLEMARTLKERDMKSHQERNFVVHASRITVQ